MLRNVQLVLKQVEYQLVNLIQGRPFPPDCFGLVGVGSSEIRNKKLPGKSMIETLQDGFLWAVPKSRRTIEKKRNRRYGWPQYFWKMLIPKTNLLICRDCGHSHEAGHLCPNCYNHIKQETQQMQEAIQAELKLDPVDKEVVVLYEGEAKTQPNTFWEGKRVVEMKKSRPSWFSKNLLQKTTTETSSSTDVKPTDLA